MKEITIYLAGKIQKAHENPNETYWTEEHQQTLRNAFAPTIVHFLNPASRTDDLSDQKSVFGRDLFQVSSADLILVDARERRGLGVGAEMMWAKMNSIPVITLAPLNSHYYKEKTSLLGVEVEGWVHPFVEGLSDYIVETLDEAAQWFKQTTSPCKDSSFMQDAMIHYLKTQLSSDEPMVALSKACPSLQKRIESLTKTP